MIDFHAPGDGTLRADGRVLKVKGANWFGTEGQHGVLYGLEERGLDDYLAFLASEGFNALRLLFSHESVFANPPTREHDVRDGKLSFDRAKTPELVGSTYLQVLELVVSRAAAHGLLVLLACHRIKVKYTGPSLHAEWPGDWDGLYVAQPLQRPYSRASRARARRAPTRRREARLPRSPQGGTTGRGARRACSSIGASSRAASARLGTCLVLI